MPYSWLISSAMMKTAVKSLYTLLPLLIVSCCVPKSGIVPETIIRCDESSVSPIPGDVIKSIDYLILKVPDDVNIAIIDKVLVSGETLFVGDYQTERILSFDRQGNFRGVIDKKGRGPGEYLSVQSFTVDDDYVFILDHFQKSILAYKRESLEFDHKLPMSFGAWDFAALSGGGFIFAYAPMEGNSVTDPALRYRIFVTDQELNIREKYFAYSEKEVDAMSIRHYLSTSGDRIVYGSYADDGFYLFNRSSGELIEKMGFAFSDGISAQEKSQITKLQDGHHTYLDRVPYLSGDRLLVSLTVGNTGNFFLLDTTTNELRINAPNPVGKFFVGVLGSDDTSFIGCFQDKTIYDHLVQNMGFQRAAPDDEAAINSDDAFLVFYRMN